MKVQNQAGSVTLEIPFLGLGPFERAMAGDRPFLARHLADGLEPGANPGVGRGIHFAPGWTDDQRGFAGLH